MSNVVLTVIGMVVTMITFAAFSVIQLGKADEQAGRPWNDDAVVTSDTPGGIPEAG
jgi:hypothetical protein